MSIRYSPRVSSSHAGIALRLMAGARNRASLASPGGVAAPSASRMAGGQQESLQREFAERERHPAAVPTPPLADDEAATADQRRRAAERAYGYARRATQRGARPSPGGRFDATS